MSVRLDSNVEQQNYNQEFGFKTEFNNVFRDFVQGLHGNRVPLNDPKTLEIFSIWNELKNSITPNQKIIIGGIEVGGAQPQVDSVFLNRDYTETMRDIRKVAPNTAIRPLERATNVFMLEPRPLDEIQFVLRQLADDTAGKDSWGSSDELLRVKIFDSQAILKEIEPVVSSLKKLRLEGYPIGVEIAIPYSNGETLKPDPYPDHYYVNKIVESARMLKEHNIPDDLAIVSLKDMVGELNAANAKRLIGAIIDGLEKSGMQIKLGLHLHDTGLATEAYAAAIAVCKNRNWPVNVDIVDSIKAKDIGYRSTGFASSLLLDELLKKDGIDLGFTSEQLNLLKKMSELTDEVAKEYALSRKAGNLNGEKLRKFKIPGGGFASFTSAVKAAGISTRLAIDEDEALEVAGEALIAVGNLMGQPFAVTPGFQNKQIAALHLIKNMIDASVLTSEMNAEEIIAKIHTKFTDKQVEELFLKDLQEFQPVLAEFLRGEMPAQVHPVIRSALGVRTGLLLDGIPSRLPKIIQTVDKLKEENLVVPTENQVHSAILQLQDTKFSSQSEAITAIQELANQMAYNSTISRGIVLGGGANLYQALTKPWLAEPLAKDFQNDADGYMRAIRKFQSGLDHHLDEADQIRQDMILSGNVEIIKAREATLELLRKERVDIHQSILEYVQSNDNLVQDAIESLIKADEKQDALATMIKELYSAQKDAVIKKTQEGKQYLYNESQRVNMSLEFLKNALTQKATSKGGPDISKTIDNVIAKIKEQIESSYMTSPVTGNVINVLVEKGDVVKKGQSLYVIEAMKMQQHVLAKNDGQVVDEVLFKKGDNVKRGEILVRYGQNIDQSLSNEVANDNNEPLSRIDRLRKQGYHGTKLDIAPGFADDKIIHIIGNRAGCAVKLLGDLTMAGHQDIRLLSIDGDKTTPIIKYAEEGTVIPIKSYMDQKNILDNLEKLANDNPSRRILFHPGWGFLSEKDDFVAKLENLASSKNLDIVFAGPPSKSMHIAGGKRLFRDVVAKAAPEFNPQYFSGDKVNLDDTRAYVQEGMSGNQFRATHSEYKKQLSDIVKMGGNVMIKAVAGGGGKGIVNFKYNDALTEQENYKIYMNKLLEIREYAAKFFGNDEVLVEQCFKGKAHHIEVQFAAGAGEGITLGLRNCTAQNGGQKFIEMNVINGDYPNELISKINKAALQTAKSLAKEGYQGLGTLEMLVSPETGKVMFLEVNTRVQVEHAVTEEDILQKTGKSISLPELNVYLTGPDSKTPTQVLKELYNIEEFDLSKIIRPARERELHFRVNSKYIDFVKGETIPSWYTDEMWPDGVCMDISSKTGAKLLQGGLGDGNSDAQIGAIYGNKEQVAAAAELMLRFSEFAQICERDYDKRINLSETLQVLPALFNEDGTMSKDFTIATVDKMLDAIKDGRMSLERDKAKELMPGQREFTFESIANAVEQIAKQLEINEQVQQKQAMGL